VPLEPQPRASSGVAERFDPPVVAVPAAVEHRLVDALSFRTLPERRTDGLRPFGLASLGVLRGDARRRDERLPGIVIDELRGDMDDRAEDRKTRPTRAAADLLADALVTPRPGFAPGLFCCVLL
jgi:hypothetical protein